ncbi:acyl-ACP--UDP-N-acetylglucosamine O-acyltransferase [Phragmitibacter flavus]|uniref:Acyl-[acyl-carrier-protein]--UDP-N-acetylglucosamine O-acyltransferase n=1 Tax=Phragmitibacter flavus TaxID=2576071 RepID=A0A5R8KAV5_9BACT|nr:acyl-ACP--UDP-N-acetylglucosamine O-acyltransferase [Phragmitibacter flavus]TLD69444.1 acyl-ACP--UDP-N-acetylglucosamine O-acyltransferase [Phragmitibacter flavus]
MASQIHATAIVHPDAVIGEDVVVGPYCVIGEGVRIGDGCTLQNHVTICGPSVIGERNQFFSFTSIGQRTQDLKYAGEPTYLEVGDDNVFREFCTVNRGTLPGTKTIVGSHNHFLSYCHIAHDCVVGNHVIFSNNGTLAGHVIVEDHVILGGLTAVHQFCRLGKHSITGGCSKIVQDCMPFTIADGNPARTRSINQVGLQRNGYGDDQVAAIRKAYKTFFRSKLNMAQAVERLKSEGGMTAEVAHMVAFVEGSQRGMVGS